MHESPLSFVRVTARNGPLCRIIYVPQWNTKNYKDYNFKHNLKNIFLKILFDNLKILNLRIFKLLLEIKSVTIDLI